MTLFTGSLYSKCNLMQMRTTNVGGSYVQNAELRAYVYLRGLSSDLEKMAAYFL
jgi:hypothetical protein